jgi:hypothetical protein
LVAAEAGFGDGKNIFSRAKPFGEDGGSFALDNVSVRIAGAAKNCPPQVLAAATKPIPTMYHGFVVASPPHALRDGEGTVPFEMNYDVVLPRLWPVARVV